MAASHPRRLNGEGAVYEVADGSGYRGAIILPSPVTGKNVKRFVRGRSRAEVIRKLNKLRADPDATFVAKETVADFLTAWLATSKGDIRPSTWEQRKQSITTHAIPALGAIKLGRLTPADVERMTANMVAAGSSPTTASLARVILRRALGDALRDGLVPRNVAALARPPRKERHELVYLDTAALRTLLESSADHDLGPLIALAATTGLRRGELMGLRWIDVDLLAGSLTVRRSMAVGWDGKYHLAEPKTKGSRRTINLPARARDALVEQQLRQQAHQRNAGKAWQDVDGMVFTNEVGQPLDADAAAHRFAAMLKAAALPRVPFHALRHSCATAMLAAGVPLKVVSETLGHSSIAITADVYAHVAPELRKDAADAMDRALGTLGLPVG